MRPVSDTKAVGIGRTTLTDYLTGKRGAPAELVAKLRELAITGSAWPTQARSMRPSYDSVDEPPAERDPLALRAALDLAHDALDVSPLEIALLLAVEARICSPDSALGQLRARHHGLFAVPHRALGIERQACGGGQEVALVQVERRPRRRAPIEPSE
ncbi:hypothetical protein BE08_25905 [Sorangium cellulosum]|uniref:Uncharacterized protein n=1 Tax=Sorangium cellulosum TaxID=56 RepID=A0A150PR17_SORCE|nr:hypothetical protein BE08_25905 [Sorangium cellulosum]